MKHKRLYIYLGIFLLVVLVGGVWFLNAPVPDEDLMTFEDEEIPLGPPGLSGSYEAGYGITWTRGSEGDDLTRFTNNDQTAKIVLIGNTDESVQLAGLTRDEAEAILGSPITRYNSIRIPVITGTSKEYYKLDGDLVILYFDGNANETVLFSAQMDRSMASDTKVFTSSNIEPYSPRDFEAMTIELLNAIRVSYGKEPLTLNMAAATVSLNHSQSMVDRNYFAHINLEGLTPKDRLRAADVPFRNYGETLTAGVWTPMDVITVWMNSPAHREILLGDFNSAGLGLATGDASYGIYFTLNLILY